MGAYRVHFVPSRLASFVLARGSPDDGAPQGSRPQRSGVKPAGEGWDDPFGPAAGDPLEEPADDPVGPLPEKPAGEGWDDPFDPPGGDPLEEPADDPASSPPEHPVREPVEEDDR